MKESHLKNTPAPDNKKVDTFLVYKTNGLYWVSFYDKDDKIMIHDIDLITPNYVYRTTESREWAQSTATTKYGANRIVKKFLAGKIKDFFWRPRPLP